MTHAVVKENGRYLDGKYFEAVVDAVMRDLTIVEIEGHTIEIVSHKVDENGNKITKVKTDE